MNICFEAEKDNDKLNKFLHNWENPTNAMTIAVNSSFAEFKVHRVDNLVIVAQTNIYDVVAKFLVYGGLGMAMMSYLIALMTAQIFYPLIWFKIGFGIIFVGILWLSPYYRYLLMYLRLRIIGYKGKLEYKNNSYAVSKLLYEREQHGAK